MHAENQRPGPGPGETVFDRFRLIRKLGEGGMGEVWQAHDALMEQPVALKFVTGEYLNDARALLLLKREAQKARVLTHPNIVRVHDFHEAPGLACISMELVEGETLHGLQEQQPGGVFEPGMISDLVAQLCEALHYAHGVAGMIHRDLKPANLMVDARGRLRVMDFGIAAPQPTVVNAFTRSLASSGTLPYMSPQQLQGAPPSPKDDLYSLGATLYECFTGAPPFYKDDIPHDILYAVPPSVRQRREEHGLDLPPIAPVWETVIAHCLAKDPARRPPNAREIAVRLAVHRSMPAGVPGVAAHQPFASPSGAAASPVVAPKPPVESVEQSRQPGGRRSVPPAVALGAALVLALLLWISGRTFRGDDGARSPTMAAAEATPPPPAMAPHPVAAPARPATPPAPAAPPLPVHLELSGPVQAIFCGPGNDLVLVDRPGGRIYLLTPGGEAAVRVVALSRPPAMESFSTAQRRLYLAYTDGRLTFVSTELGGTRVEEEFARHPAPPVAIQAIEYGLLVADRTGAWGSLTSYPESGGHRAAAREWFAAPRHSAWCGRAGRAYFLTYDHSPRDIGYEEIGSDLALGRKGDSPYHDSTGMDGPIVALGRFIALGSGRLFDPLTLTLAATLPFKVGAGAPVGESMFVAEMPSGIGGRGAADAAGATRIHRIGPRGEDEADVGIPGRFVGMAEWAGSLAVASDLGSKTAVFFLDPNLDFIDAPAPRAEDAPRKPVIIIKRSAPAS